MRSAASGGRSSSSSSLTSNRTGCMHMHRTGEIELRVVRCVSVNAHCATDRHSYLLLPTAAWDAHPAALQDSPPAMVRASLFPMSDARSLRGSRCEGRSAKVCLSSDSVHLGDSSAVERLEIHARADGRGWPWDVGRVGMGSARYVVHGLRGLQGGRAMPPGSSGPRSRQGCFEPSGIGHGSWASVVGGHGVSANHANGNGSCIMYMRHGRLAVVRRVWCTCVCQMKVKKGGTEFEGKQSNHHLSHGQARSSTGSDLGQRSLHSYDGRARAGAAE